MNWSLVYTFFRTLPLAHLERSLYSLSRQTLLPEEMIFFENNTDFSEEEIKQVVSQHFDLNRWKFFFNKHGDPRKTASWCQNTAIRLATHEVFILAKADLIYDFSCFQRLTELFSQCSQAGAQPMHFTTSHVMQMGCYSGIPVQQVDHAADLEPLGWREDVQRLHKNQGNGSQYHTQTQGDAASFCTTKTAMASVNWYDEELIGWGYWQLSLQWDMAAKGVQFHVIPECLMFHMLHCIEGPERCLQRAQAEYDRSSRRGR